MKYMDRLKLILKLKQNHRQTLCLKELAVEKGVDL